ncbi:hypothetical protein FE257_003673 [Aspergillus nanangensis]|uniref:Uncharacterized protein n=1 Tax=Aspergillus nanangensis TaxID=2582783 RepID=A0AAD4CS08_ASPNN|nr:hypothetical protein FE257_003673 [Aspergillus nanangensis]
MVNQCSVPGCRNQRLANHTLCHGHTCVYQGCTSSRRAQHIFAPGADVQYCAQHSCTRAFTQNARRVHCPSVRMAGSTDCQAHFYGCNTCRNQQTSLIPVNGFNYCPNCYMELPLSQGPSRGSTWSSGSWGSN